VAIQDSAAQNQQWVSILSQLGGVVWSGVILLAQWDVYLAQQLFYGSFWAVLGKCLLLAPPATVLVLGTWGTMVSVFTIPFRLGRAGSLLTGLLMSWWDGLRMSWFYWAGLVRFLVVLVGWMWGLLKAAVQLVWGTV